MKQRKKIAICTITYNRWRYCQRSLESLLKGDRTLFDLYVYNNGSTDDTAAYLESIKQQYDNVYVVQGEKNLGTAGGTKKLLREHVFGNGYEFIGKNDDDELLPADWPNILAYWDDIERDGAVLAGFKRSCTDDYFNGLKWISRKKENLLPLYYGPYECYLSYIVPGFQFSREEWWKRLYPKLSDFGCQFGGWDVSCALAIKALHKQCLVVYNRESIHFQKWEDHPQYTRLKMQQIRQVRQRVNEMREAGSIQQ